MPAPIRASGDPAAEIARRREEILELARRHGAQNVRVFGSVACGEADAASDVDFLVDLEPGRSLLDLGGLVMDLADLLRRPVDGVTTRGLRARMRQRVLNEAIPVQMRNVLTHGYFEIDLDIVWSVVERDLGKLQSQVETIVREC